MLPVVWEDLSADICWSVCLCIGQDGQQMLEEGQGLCRWIALSLCG